MRRSEALRYARWSATIAGAAFVLFAGMYARRAWQHARTVRSAPPAVPATVQQQSSKFGFSKAIGELTLFKVESSHATVFTQGNRNVLEDVAITIFGQRGDRKDRIRTGQCEYFSDTGKVVCNGAVHMELEAERDARERPGQQMVRVDTSKVTFLKETGASHSEQPVRFSFPYGEGRAVGFTYDANRSVVRLEHDVNITLRGAGAQHPEASGAPLRSAGAQQGGAQQGGAQHPEASGAPLRSAGAQPFVPQGKPSAPPQPGAPASAPATEITASSLDYHNEDGSVYLQGPVHLRQGPEGSGREVTCDTLNLELTPALRAKRMLPGGRTELISREKQGTSTLAADVATLDFSAYGQPLHLHAEGRVTGTRKAAGYAGEQHFASDRLDVEFDPRTGVARHATAEGNVALDSPERAPADGINKLTTATLFMDFATGQGGRTDLRRAESPVPSVVEMESARGTSILRPRRLTADYGPGSILRQLHGREGVEIERRLPNQPVQTSRSDSADVDFAAGRWTEARQDGNVRFEEAAPAASRRTGHAEHARLVEPSDTLTLTKNAELADAESVSAAPTFILNQRTGDANGEGGVRTTYRRVDPQSALNFAPQPAHITAERLAANRATGHALYSGHARMWQGDAVIQADALELRRDERELAGTGNVNARLPQVAPPPGAENQTGAGASTAPAGAGSSVPQGTARGAAAATSAASPAPGPGEPVIWAVRAARLLYRSADSVAGLDEGVRAESRLGRISAPHMDLFLAETNGVRQLSKAVSTGGVTVWQGVRRGTAERSDYNAADGSFLLKGGDPTLFDADQGTTKGRELTFFLADDRILVGSGDGTRTVSRHRIQ